MGQYAESQGHFETAMEYYDMVNDSLSKVRILCSMGNVDEVCYFLNGLMTLMPRL